MTKQFRVQSTLPRKAGAAGPPDGGVDSRHHAAPFVARLVEIGVTNAAIQNFDLYIFRARLTAKDRGARETRCWASSSIRFRDIASFPLRLRLFFERDRLSGFVHFLNLLVVHNFRCPPPPESTSRARQSTCKTRQC